MKNCTCNSSNSTRLRLVRFSCCHTIFQIALSSMRLPILILVNLLMIVCATHTKNYLFSHVYHSVCATDKLHIPANSSMAPKSSFRATKTNLNIPFKVSTCTSSRSILGDLTKAKILLHSPLTLTYSYISPGAHCHQELFSTLGPNSTMRPFLLITQTKL